jgi:hypothetical protein
MAIATSRIRNGSQEVYVRRQSDRTSDTDDTYEPVSAVRDAIERDDARG